MSVLRTAAVMQRHLAQVVEAHGITIQQYNVLRILRGAGEAGLPTLAIRDRMVEEAAGITRLLDKLESAGHVVRERSHAGPAAGALPHHAEGSEPHHHARRTDGRRQPARRLEPRRARSAAQVVELLGAIRAAYADDAPRSRSGLRAQRPAAAVALEHPHPAHGDGVAAAQQRRERAAAHAVEVGREARRRSRARPRARRARAPARRPAGRATRTRATARTGCVGRRGRRRSTCGRPGRWYASSLTS